MTVVVDRPALPTRRDEAWRYAPHRTLAELTFGPATSGRSLPANLESQFPDLDGPRIVVIGGMVDPELSRLAAPDGVQISTLAEHAGSPVVAPHVDVAEPADAFEALNLEFGVDGAVVDVTDGARIDVPIHIVDVAVPDPDRNASCAGVVVRLGAGSAATVVETRIGVGEELAGSNIRTTVTLGEDAELEHVLLQDLPPSQVQLGLVRVTQAARSRYCARSFNLGGAYGRIAFDVLLDGAEAHADLSGLFFGFGDQTLDQQLNVIHAVENCTSRQFFRGVLDDSSTGVFRGGIDVRPGADGTDAEQSNANLVLSDRAEVNTQPRLEILADEVACSHGATVGQLDETALYYLRSRGIAADDARRLLINGFADQVVDDVGLAEVRSWIAHRLGHDVDA